MADNRITAWAVVNRRGDIMADTLARTRGTAIKRIVGDEPGWQGRWRWWRDGQQCRTARVIVTLDEDRPNV